MSKYNNTCAICGMILKDSRNALSLHLRNSHKDIIKEEYYKLYVDSRTTCIKCGANVKFKNLQLGYPELCSKCGHHTQWEGEKGEARRELHRKILLDRGPNTLGGGRPKDSKNKNPYPVDSVYTRPQNQKNYKRDYNSDPEKVAKQKLTWANKTEEQIEEFNTKRTNTLIMNNTKKYYQGKYTPTNVSKYEGDPTQIIYRSSWEKRFFIWCDTSDSVLKWSSETIIIPYICPTDNNIHRYFVDAKITVRDKNSNIKTYLIEIKPDIQTRPPVQKKRKTKGYINEVFTYAKNEAKWKAAIEYCKQRNYEFKLITEYELGLKKR